MLAAAPSSPREVKRPAKDGASVGCVLDYGAMSALPRVTEFEIPPGPSMDWASARCRELWTAVLAVMVEDARGKGMGATAHRTLSMGVARAWLRRPSADRDLVLELAGIDVAAFESRGLPRLEAHWRDLDAAKVPPPRYVHGFSRVSGRCRAA